MQFIKKRFLSFGLSLLLIVGTLFCFSGCEVEKSINSLLKTMKSVTLKSETYTTSKSDTKSSINQVSSAEKDDGKSTAPNKTRQKTTAKNKTVSSKNSTAKKGSTKKKKNEIEQVTYEDITCVEIYSYNTVSFSVSDENTVLRIMLPEEWNLKKNGSSYNIIKNSKKIGTISSTTIKTDKKTVNVFNHTVVHDELEITHDINRVTSAKKPTFTRTITYKYNDIKGKKRSIILNIPYQEINIDAADRMVNQATLYVNTIGQNLGILKINDNRNKVLVLGNSFIATSQIGSILQEMCGDSIVVDADSRGYARVTTYATDENMMSTIREGNYSAVFMCGFYDDGSVPSFQTIIDACKFSNTKLAMFPAHNENDTIISLARAQYPSTIMVDWKSEINALINNGISYNDFCIDDSHKHSTALAGYVGAHMIYRAVFGKIPTKTDFTAVSQNSVLSLGDYVTTGIANSYSNKEIYSLK